MELHADFPEGISVAAVQADGILVGERRMTRSFLVTPERLVASWPAVDAACLGSDAIEPILALDPELVVLGTGPDQVFPDPETLSRFLSRGIGFEAMANPAAARTFNLLASERRHVVAAFVLAP